MLNLKMIKMRDDFLKTLMLMSGMAIAFFAAGQDQILTLDQSTELALKNYPLIKKYELLDQSKEFNLSNASKAYLPQFSATIIAGLIDGLPSFSSDPNNPPSDGAEFNVISLLQLNQVIWDGGRTKAQKEIIEAQTEIQKADIEIQMYEIERRIVDLYFGLILLEEQSSQLKTLEETLNTNLKRVEAAYKNGVAYQSDLDEINVELINVRQQQIEIKFAKDAFREMLSFLTGVEISNEVELEKPEPENSVLWEEINRPELSQFINQRNLIESRSQFDKSNLYPNVGLTGIGVFVQPGADFGPETINDILVGGLSFSWNIGSLYRNSNTKKLNQISLQTVDVTQETFEFSTNLTLTKLREEIKKYDELLAMDQQLIELRGQLRKSYEIKYDNGVAGLTDLIGRINDESLANQNFTLHELQKLQVYYNYKIESGN